MLIISSNEIHIWTSHLRLTTQQEDESLNLLSNDECIRAKRFHFPIHRKRFVAARSTLRNILSCYLNILPKEIIFLYDDYQKPYLKISFNTDLQFNVSHSHDIALFAFSYKRPIGVDIEKIKATYNDHVARRYFSEKEYQSLMSLPEQERINGFYSIWAKKEAIIKAVGKGLAMPLNQFSVSIQPAQEFIQIDHTESWTLLPLSIDIQYQAAVATNQAVHTLSYWRLQEGLPKLIHTERY